MIDDVLAQPAQVADALWRVEAADIPRRDLFGGLLVCGMGGSAVGGDLAAAAIGRRASRPVRTVRGYAPEPWVGPDTLVLCSSYSGSTEETLACFEAAGEAGAPRVAPHPGQSGRPPSRHYDDRIGEFRRGMLHVTPDRLAAEDARHTLRLRPA